MDSSEIQTNGHLGKLIVITAPLTESIDHAGYFIQMGMASMPIWMEGVLNSKYPHWRDVQKHEDGSAKYMPAGVRLVEASLLREYDADDIGMLLPGRPGKVYWSENPCGRGLYSQPSWRDIRCRSLHIDLWQFEDADQFPLRASHVQRH